MRGFQLKKKSRARKRLRGKSKWNRRHYSQQFRLLLRCRRCCGHRRQRCLDRGEHRTVRLTLAVPRSLHTRLKLATVQQKRSIVSLVSGWIEERTVAD